MKKYALSILVLLFVFSLAFAGDNYEVKDLAVKVIETSGSHVEVSFKVEVQNYGEPDRLYIKIQGVDGDGFEILLHNFSERFDQNESKTLTETRLYDIKKYNMVKKWIINN